MDPERPIDRVADHWEAVVDDMTVTAEEYREAGVEVVELHPGDVVPRPDVGGFDVLVPDPEFDALRDLLADATLSESDVFRARASGVAFFVAVLVDPDGSAAVCCPLYYHLGDEETAALQRDAAEAGTLRAFVRPLANDEAVTLEFDDPDVFFGDGATGPAKEGPEERT
jgi:hypothetical protein